jgi:hypothetical protein
MAGFAAVGMAPQAAGTGTLRGRAEGSGAEKDEVAISTCTPLLQAFPPKGRNAFKNSHLSSPQTACRVAAAGAAVTALSPRQDRCCYGAVRKLLTSGTWPLLRDGLFRDTHPQGFGE